MFRALPPGQAAFNRVIKDYKRNAKKRGLAWELSDSIAKSIVTQNCFYCGEQPKNKSTAGNKSTPFLYNGIDRINSNIGYVMYNCLPCCFDCNRAKSDKSIDEFKVWLTRIYNHTFKKDI